MPIIDGFLMPHPPVIIPEVGRGRERDCQSTLDALDTIGRRIKELKPETIIVITPHGPVFSDGLAISSLDVLSGSLASFGSPEVSFTRENNTELVNSIVRKAGEEGIVVAKVDTEFAEEYGISTEVDHGALVPLYFVDQYYTAYKIVHITYGLLSRSQLYRFGMTLKEAVNQADENAVIIASGDLSHCLKDSGPYSFDPAGPEFDNEIINYIENGDFLGLLKMDSALVDNAKECGYRSLNILAGTLDGHTIIGKSLSYEGPFGVGYAVAEFTPNLEDSSEGLYTQIAAHRKHILHAIRSNEDPYVKLARETIEKYILEGQIQEVGDDLPEEMLKEIAGVFVSIKSEGGLRGCIGTIAPTTVSIAKEIVSNAIKASTEDPRFNPIEAHELDDLTISVDILRPAEKVESVDELDTEKYGVIVTSGYKRGLLLPNLDGVDTVKDQLDIVLRKAGIESTEAYEIQRFEVIRHK